MITFSMKKLRISLTFGFFFVVAITYLRDNSIGTVSLLFCIAHEFGHLIAMAVFGTGLSEIRFYGAGIKILADGLDLLSKPKRAAVYLAGVAVNFLAALIFPGSIRTVNLCLGFFNLLPISYFDGGKLVNLLIPKSFFTNLLSAGSYALLAALLVVSAIKNPAILSASSLVTVGFIAFSHFLDE